MGKSKVKLIKIPLLYIGDKVIILEGIIRPIDSDDCVYIDPPRPFV